MIPRIVGRTSLLTSAPELFAEAMELLGHVRIQRWSFRRVVLTASVAFGLFLAVGMLVSNWTLFA